MKQAIYVLNADGSIDNTVVLNFPHFGNISMITADADNNIILIGRLNLSQTFVNRGQGHYSPEKVVSHDDMDCQYQII